jgi:hypothetical protein
MSSCVKHGYTAEWDVVALQPGSVELSIRVPAL